MQRLFPQAVSGYCGVDTRLIRQVGLFMFNPNATEFIANPHPTLHTLRDDDPVHWSDALGGWVLTRYDDVKAAQIDRRFSADRLTPFAEHVASDVWAGENRKDVLDMAAQLKLWTVFKDPPDHTRLRRLMVDAFTPRAIEALRFHIRAIVDELLDGLAGRNDIDLIQDFAYPLPARVIAHILGVPTNNMDRFRRWSDDVATVVGSARLTSDRYRRGAEALTEITAYFRELVAQRRKSNAQGTLIDTLIATSNHDHDGRGLSNDELVANCVFILFAGHETTTNLIANGIIALLAHPDQLALLRADPELMPSAIEEMLRFESPAQSAVRIASEDMVIGGKGIRAGDRIFLMFIGANRDPAHFSDPDRFDITRNPNRHLAFGYGLHFCIGAQLARVEGHEALTALLARCPNIAHASDVLEWDDSLVLRGVRRLPLRLSHNEFAA